MGPPGISSAQPQSPAGVQHGEPPTLHVGIWHDGVCVQVGLSMLGSLTQPHNGSPASALTSGPGPPSSVIELSCAARAAFGCAAVCRAAIGETTTAISSAGGPASRRPVRPFRSGIDRRSGADAATARNDRRDDDERARKPSAPIAPHSLTLARGRMDRAGWSRCKEFPPRHRRRAALPGCNLAKQITSPCRHRQARRSTSAKERRTPSTLTALDATTRNGGRRVAAPNRKPLATGLRRYNRDHEARVHGVRLLGVPRRLLVHRPPFEPSSGCGKRFVGDRILRRQRRDRLRARRALPRRVLRRTHGLLSAWHHQRCLRNPGDDVRCMRRIDHLRTWERRHRLQ